MSKIEILNNNDFSKIETEDFIKNLPVDNSENNIEHNNTINNIFKENKKCVKDIGNQIKEVILFGIFFFIISLPQLDEIIKKFICITRNSIYYLILIKCLIFMLIYWVIQHFNLVLS